MAKGNTNEGFRVGRRNTGSDADNTTLVGNKAIDNGTDGILVRQSATGTVLEDNTANKNTDDGIDVDDAATTITGNTAIKNGGLGIEAVAGVDDGGGNKAHANGEPEQCQIVVC